MRLSLALLAVAFIGQSHAVAGKFKKERVQPKVAASMRQAPRFGVLANLREAMEALQEGSRRNLNMQAGALDFSPQLHSLLDSFQEESLSSASAEPSLEPTAAPTSMGGYLYYALYADPGCSDVLATVGVAVDVCQIDVNYAVSPVFCAVQWCCAGFVGCLVSTTMVTTQLFGASSS
jgi:hypothetical protein